MGSKGIEWESGPDSSGLEYGPVAAVVNTVMNLAGSIEWMNIITS
jgi:hypothetical protein